MADDKRAVLNALLAQTNTQGEWTPRRALRLTAVAHGRVTPAGFDTAVDILVEDGLVDEREDELRPADGVERIPHPGEKSTS